MKNDSRQLLPKHLLTEEERIFINKEYKPATTCMIVADRIKVPCYLFNEDAFNILDDLDTYRVLNEAVAKDSNDKAFATRASTVVFQCVRELSSINGANLIEVAKGVKTVGRLAALAAIIALGNIDTNSARRILPVIRAL